MKKTRIALLLNSILWAVIFIGLIYTLIAPIILDQLFSAMLTGTVVVAGVIARQLMFRGHVRAASIILLVVFDLILILSIIISNGTFGASYSSLVLTTVLAGVLLGGRGGYTFAGINTLIGLGIMLFQDSLPVTMIPQNPVTFFSSLVVYVFFIAALLQASAQGFDKLTENLRRTQQELTEKNQEMQKFAVGLEATIAARTAELNTANIRIERRAKQFEAISKISRVISQTQNLDILLPQITELISQQFNFYHIGIFLMDVNMEYAVLIAANSVGGKKMLARNHKLKVGQTGIVGYVAGSKLPRIALDTGADAIYFNNPDLPETRSELALPLLRKANEIIGVLDVQSQTPNAFSQEDVRTLTTLADQVSIAIENAKLFEEQQRVLLETQAFYNNDLREGWGRFTRAQNIAGIQRRNLKNSFLPEPLELPGAVEAVRSGAVFQKVESDGTSLLTIPIRLREQTVGILNVKSGYNRNWSDDELDIVSAIVGRAALSIENARLLEDSQRIAQREHVIGEISSKIGASTQIEDILKTAVRELGMHISGSQVTVEIGSDD
ncbi:MAG: GAF domain-containing protein [Anaerolineales bacterium]|uniref:GAF domain-containing protein n=1 Tax=Candidatus Villigracilis vicinus TaxID=3140679 RepID=UPI0031355B84|nr:GAF domain-containing protein [Anaerolineales bacterium]